MKAIIITIGDELLMGQVLDSNSCYMARRLTDIGVEVTEIYTISDKQEEIFDVVDMAMQRVDLILVTGGLGPTKDDVTKKVLAEYFGTRLVLNEQALDWLKELLRIHNLTMNENNKSQAYLPEKCRILRNFKGTASGMWFEKGWKSLISLPGVPFEMEHLMEKYVIPDLKTKYPDLQLEFRMLKVYDVAESLLAQHLDAWEDSLPDGIKLAYLPSPGLVKLRLTAKGEAVHQLEGIYEDLKKCLKGMRVMEGEDTLEKQIGILLRKQKATLATAESCTGGEIARLITSIPGASDYFKGGVVAYANEVKVNVLGVNPEDIEQEGAVSEMVVVQMAQGIQKLLKTDYALATSGIAGPDGGTEEKPVGTVWIAIATPKQVKAQKFMFSFTRERNIAKASAKALEWLLKEIAVTIE